MFGELQILQGECLAAKHHGKRSILVGENLAESKKLKPGNDLTLCDEKFRIVGIYRSGSDLENSMVLPLLDDAQRICGKRGRSPRLSCEPKTRAPRASRPSKPRSRDRWPKSWESRAGSGQKPSADFNVPAQAGRDFRYPPVESVSWNDAQKFCRRLSTLPAEQAAGLRYRLPTEAEWEYAARVVRASTLARQKQRVI